MDDASESGTQNGADDANESGNGLWDQRKEALRKSSTSTTGLGMSLCSKCFSRPGATSQKVSLMAMVSTLALTNSVASLS